MKDLLMENDFLTEAKEHALKYKNEESCGLIVQGKNNKIFLKSKNISLNKIQSFGIDPLCYLYAKEYGEIVGCFHSHIKDSSFSFSDITNSFKHNLTYYLYNIKKDKFYIFDPKQNQKYLKYLNLPYENGVQDCHILLKNFYLNELNLDIDVKNVPERKGIKYEDLKENKEHIWSLEKYQAEYIRNGFEIFLPRKIEDFKIYDVIVFAGFEKNVPTHGALFLENDMILHQRYNFISILESFRKAHFKYITYCLRHKSINI
jgi:proteasome lid subunit RPN8/RPN11